MESKSGVDLAKEYASVGVECLYHTRIAAFLKGYAAGKAEAQRWIPCSERLPEKDGEYWIYRIPRDGYGSQSPVSAREFINGVWITRQTVTHWMPLPPTPEEQLK